MKVWGDVLSDGEQQEHRVAIWEDEADEIADGCAGFVNEEAAETWENCLLESQL